MVCHDERTHARHTERIRELNDRLRQTGVGGRTMLTRAVAALPPQVLAALLAAVRDFDDFCAANDPWSEHDFGSVIVRSENYFWKTEYMDLDLEFGSPDPADEARTCRVLTIMAASDY